jgi:hypothetical protein
MSKDLRGSLLDLADEMDGTDFAALRSRTERTQRQIGRRNTAAVTLSAIAVVAALAGGGYAFLPHRASPTPGIASTTAPATPTETASPAPSQSPTHAAAPTVVPGSLLYLTVRTGQPIVLTTVTDGVSHQATFGTATESDTYVLVPSPDGTQLAAIESPDPGTVAPGDLVIIQAGGHRRTLATHVPFGGGDVPVWMPDGRHLLAMVGGKSQLIDVATGHSVPAQPAEGNGDYLTWSANGQWRAYAGSNEIVVTAADGSAAVHQSVASLPECQQTAGCPTSVQAVSDDGHFVAVGHMNSDPTHVTEAHLVIDMRTGALVTLPVVKGNRVDRVYFRPGGGMIVRAHTDSGTFTILIVAPDGTILASLPDTLEQIGRHLAGYRP